MKPSLILHEIVRSLSNEEKSNFLQAASLQQGEKNYMKLFSYLDSVEVYDEEDAKEFFKNETFAKHLASEKNQLFHHILKSLRQKRIQDNSSAAAFEKTKDVFLLYKKSLPSLAAREAERIRYKCQREELFYALLDLIETEIHFISEHNYSKEEKHKRLSELLNEKEEHLQNISVLNKYLQLKGEIEYYFNQNILVHDQSKKHLLESFLNNPYIADLKHANSKKALLLATYCRLICYRLVRDHDKLGVEVKKAIELFKTHAHLINEYPKLYIHLYGFYARYRAISGDLKGAKTAIDHIHSIKDDRSFSTQDLQNTIFTRLAVYDLTFYNYSGQFEKADDMLPYIEQKMMEPTSHYPAHELTTINFLMFVTNYSKKNYNKALKAINDILNSDFDESRQDLYRFAKICNLIVHYELNNTEFLNYSFKSTQRFFKMIDYPFEYEISFLKHFKNIAISKKRPENKKSYFIEFRAHLEEIFKDPYQMIASEYFDLIAWVDSKINETDYAQEIIKLRTNQK